MAKYYSVTGTPTELLNLVTVKEHLRVTDTNEDTLITNLIPAARGIAENYTGRFIAARTIDVISPCFTDVFELVYTPVTAIVSVKYIDINNTEQTLAPSKYNLVQPNLLDSRIVFTDIPTVKDVWNATTIKATSGFSGLPNGVPQAIKNAMLLIIGDLYENRESRAERYSSSWQSLLRPYRTF